MKSDLCTNKCELNFAKAMQLIDHLNIMILGVSPYDKLHISSVHVTQDRYLHTINASYLLVE